MAIKWENRISPEELEESVNAVDEFIAAYFMWQTLNEILSPNYFAENNRPTDLQRFFDLNDEDSYLSKAIKARDKIGENYKRIPYLQSEPNLFKHFLAVFDKCDGSKIEELIRQNRR